MFHHVKSLTNEIKDNYLISHLSFAITKIGFRDFTATSVGLFLQLLLLSGSTITFSTLLTPILHIYYNG